MKTQGTKIQTPFCKLLGSAVPDAGLEQKQQGKAGRLSRERYKCAIAHKHWDFKMSD